MLISVCINCDTRIGFQQNSTQQNGLFNGCLSEDFLDAGIFNKAKFFDGFDIELIVFIDKHQEIPEKTLSYLHSIADTVVVRRHTHEEKFNDWNYVNCLSLCRGDIICHFDQDIAAFASSKYAVQELIDMLDSYSFISYPSPHSPFPAHDPNYDYVWCSTRFFICKKESIDITELSKCLKDMDYLYEKYPASVKNPWTEHCLGLMAKYNGKGVYYPPINDRLLIWCWDNYDKYILNRLNSLPYEEVKKFVYEKGGIFYPNNLRV